MVFFASKLIVITAFLMLFWRFLGLKVYQMYQVFHTKYWYTQPIFETISDIRVHMEIKEAQQLVDNWIKTMGIRYFNELTNTAILMEEVGEVARIMSRQYGEQSFKKSDTEVNLADEMADVLFVLICLANQTGIDLTDALEKNMQKKSIRDADRHKNNEKLK